MRLTILAVGSRGDAQPYTALGLGLQRAGHDVKIATHEVFREMATERGLGFGLIRLNPQEMLKQEAGQAWMEAGKNPVRFIRHMARAFAPLLHEMLKRDAKRGLASLCIGGGQGVSICLER